MTVFLKICDIIAFIFKHIYLFIACYLLFTELLLDSAVGFLMQYDSDLNKGHCIAINISEALCTVHTTQPRLETDR